MINNETLGIAAEKVICDLNQIDSSHLSHRSDYMLLIYIDSPDDGFFIYEKESIPNLEWEIGNFQFTRGLEDWNESTTIKYNGISIAEFQLHNHRNCYKFRFHILNLFNVIEKKII
tara:strand:- start:2959 stop:3306 length:348 start_codon:yes stop_codon:yes gene_type:complete